MGTDHRDDRAGAVVEGALRGDLDGELVFSKAELKRHAEPGEVAGLVRQRLGPEIERG
jgi:hypothetical protein